MVKSNLRYKGFTLLEVLVALAIIGVLLPPLLMNSAQRISGMKQMEDRMLASMVANNQLTLAQLRIRLVGGKPERNDEGVEELADREWLWKLETEETEIQDYYRVTFIVSAAEKPETMLSTITGFLRGGGQGDG